MTFAGFPARPQATAIPNVFFSDVLPLLADDPAATGVALYAFRALLATHGYPRYVEAGTLTADAGLGAYIAAVSGGAGAIERGLTRVCDVGMLLPLTVERDGARRTLYFLNAPADRRGLEAVRSGAVDLGRPVPVAAATGPARSGIFALYESLIGTMSPLIADELAEADRLYPQEWLEGAFREAAAQNARSWRYVSRILERWAVEGRDHAKTERDPAAESRYLSGKYGAIVRRRLEP